MNLKIDISGPQGSGKSAMVRFIMEICDRERITYRMKDGEIGHYNVAKDEGPEVVVTTWRT